jgi:hypothetical protein
MSEEPESKSQKPRELREADLWLSLERLGLEIGKLPTLKVIPVGALLLHEEPDPRRLERLKVRIEATGVVRNPLIAAKDHGAASHILLDGVNRLEALKTLGARYVLVQEVDFDDEHLVLSVWHHAVEGLDVSAMFHELASQGAIRDSTLEFTEHGDLIPRFSGDHVCCIVLPERAGWVVMGGGSAESNLEVLRRVVGLTERAANRDRVSYTNMDDLCVNYHSLSALLCYKAFSKDDLLRLTLEGKHFPSGVTRFSVPKRALEFKVSLSFLREAASPEAKQAELQRMILDKIRGQRIRFYEEPTFYFDD